MKKTKVCLCALTAVASVGVISAVALNNANVSPSSANDNPYSIELSLNKALTKDEADAKTFERSNASEWPITFKLNSLSAEEGSFAKAASSNSWLYNETPINGLEKFTIRCSAKKFKVFFFSEPVNSNRNNYVACSEEMTGAGGTTDLSITVPKFKDPIKYIVWNQTESSGNWIKSIKYEFSCSTTLANRGKQFEAGAKDPAIDFDDVSVESGSVTVDVKWETEGTISMSLLNGWSSGLGYKTVSNTTKTGDVAGLTVLPLSDGYTRLIWKLSEMVKPEGYPAIVNKVHIDKKRDTNCSGYVDMSTVEVVQYYGTKLESGINTSFTYDEVSLAGKIVQIDIFFDNTCSEDSKSAFYVCDSSKCDTYYGNFNLYRNKVDDQTGLTFVGRLTNGYSRYTLDLDTATKGTTPKPTTSIYSYSRGNWSTASGYIAIEFLTK